MELKDLLITPIVLIFIYIGAYFIRPWVTDTKIRRYFFPALTVKIFGAIALGFIYQFYYGGGDTFAFHTHGSSILWEAFIESPIKGFKLLFASGVHQPEIFEYSSQIWYYRDQPSYFVVRVAALFDLLTFKTYSATATLFAVLSFSGLWVLFKTFYELYPKIHLKLAIAVLFVPSVIFWGSGILKDTLTLAALGWATYSFHKIFIKKEKFTKNFFYLFISVFILFSVKKYMLLCFIPASILWVSSNYISEIKSIFLRWLIIPIVIFAAISVGYFAIIKVGEDDPRYSIEKLAQTAKITAYDIRYWTGKDAGSGYSLGELDGTFTGMLELAPQAINVSLFRPYFWEVNNVLMFIASLESFFILILTLYILFNVKWTGFWRIVKNPEFIFTMTFSLVFAFAVGISTFNFGTLMRYKIPLIPFYLIGLFLMDHLNSERKFSEFESTE